LNDGESRSGLIFMAIIALIAWFALVLQLYLNVTSGTPVALALLNYFSYFTILTNILVAVGVSSALWANQTATGQFFSQTNVKAGTAIYIAIVGVVYFLLLRNTWNPQGLQKLADILLHYVTPLLYVSYWLAFAPKQTLRWKDAFLWLAYPLAYLIYALLRGVISGFYPYPFIDVHILGYPRVFLNAAVLTLVFLGLGLVAVAWGRGQKASHSS